MQVIEKHIDPITRGDLEELLQIGAPPRISMYLPTEREWNKSKQNPTRLKNLLSQTEEHLEGRGMKERDVQDLLAPAYQLVEERAQFWQHQSDGLALFIAPGHFTYHRLPLRFDERLVVGEPFHVRPLLKYLQDDGWFYLLSLTQNEVHLYRCAHYALEEVELEDTPTSLPESVQRFDFEAQLSFHTGSAETTGGKRAAIFHGQADAGDKAQIKKRIVQFFRELDNGVRDILASDPTPAPLLLAGGEQLRGLYRAANQYQHLVDSAVEGNPSDWETEELHQRAWEIIEPRFRADREQAAADYQQLAASEPSRTPDSIDEVVPAALYERIDTLFVPDAGHVWGTFNQQEEHVATHVEREPADVDLLDLAVEHTLLNSGTVYSVDPSEIPGGAPVAAILRY